MTAAKICTTIHFLHAKDTSTTEIHHKLYQGLMHKMQRMDPAFTLLLEQYRKNGDELLNHVI
jgi:hypothetical protein